MRWILLTALFSLQACTCNRGTPITRGDAPPVVVVDPDEAKIPPADAEKEPNDSRKSAQLMARDKWIEGALRSSPDQARDQDWYRIKISQGSSILRATLTGVPGLDLVLEAFNAGGKRLVSVNNNAAGGGEVLVNLAVLDEDVYLRVSRTKGASSSRGRYRITYRLRDREEGEELEPNWKSAMATPLVMDEDAVGYLGWNRDNDWFVVKVPEDLSADSRIRVEYDGLDNVRANLSLRDGRGKVVQARWSPLGGGVTLANLVLPAGAKILHVVVRCHTTANPESRYYLRVLASVPPGPTEREPNHKPELATPLSPGTPVAGLLADNLDHDLYVVKVTEPTMIRAEATVPLDLDVALAVMTAEGKVLWEANDGKRREPEVIPAFPVQPPAAYLRVRAPRRGAVSAVSPYRLKAKLVSESGLEREPNDKRTAANNWPGPQSVLRGYMHPTKDVDYFRLVASGEQLKLVAQPPSGMALKVELLDASGTMVASSKQDAAFGKVQLNSPVKPDDVYYLRISAPGTTNPDREYQLEME